MNGEGKERKGNKFLTKYSKKVSPPLFFFFLLFFCIELVSKNGANQEKNGPFLGGGGRQSVL
jgi:hypothetical protein